MWNLRTNPLTNDSTQNVHFYRLLTKVASELCQKHLIVFMIFSARTAKPSLLHRCSMSSNKDSKNTTQNRYTFRTDVFSQPKSLASNTVLILTGNEQHRFCHQFDTLNPVAVFQAYPPLKKPWISYFEMEIGSFPFNRWNQTGLRFIRMYIAI